MRFILESKLLNAKVNLSEVTDNSDSDNKVIPSNNKQKAKTMTP